VPIPEEMAPVRRSQAVVRTLVVAMTVLVIGLATAIPAQAGEMHTGLRAAAIKKCRQKFEPGPRLDICLKKAKYEPR